VRPRIELDLFDRQADALESRLDELLVGGDQGRGGCSYLLRAMAAVLCFETPGLRAVLVQKNEGELRKSHLEGPDGLVALLADAQRSNAVTVTPNEIRFWNGSSIRWSGCARDAEVSRLLEQRVDFLAVDNLHEVPEALYSRLRDRVLTGVGPLRRIVAASNRVSEGWVARHWNGIHVPGRGFIPMGPADIDPELREGKAPRSFRDFINDVRPGFKWLPHTEILVRVIQGLVDGLYPNVAVFMPPQHGKSECGPRLGAAYKTERFPTDWTGIASYATQKANERNFDAREYFRRAGGEVRFGAAAVNSWQTLYGGGCWSAGVAAGQTGNPMTTGIIDDPDKDLADAISPTERDKKRAWYRDVWRARESMFGETPLSQLLIQTRWDTEDTGSYILRRAAEAGERWHIVCLPALYDPDVPRQFTDPGVVAEVFGKKYADLFPQCFTVEPDWRTEPGEAIWPDRRSREEWENFRDNVVGPMIFAAEWQQNPRPAVGGGILDRTWFHVIYPDQVAELGAAETSCRAWDDGATEDGGDSTAGILMDRLRGTGPVQFLIRHAIEAKIAGAKVKPLKVETAKADGHGVYVKIPQDPGGSGKTDAEATEAALVAAGHPRDRVIKHRPSGSKVLRARDFASAASPPPGQARGKVGILVDERGYVGGGYEGEVAITTRRTKEIFGGDSKEYSGGGSVPLARILEQFHRFTGADGQEDDLVDSAADAHAQVAKPRKKLSVF
jgi:phage terminase large subunit-like protein